MTTPYVPQRVLIVEDEMLIALMLEDAVREAGFAPLGPFPSVATALHAIGCESLDGAILDMHLGRERAYPLADALAARNIPFVLVSGQPRACLPERFQSGPIVGKPCMAETVVAALQVLMRVGDVPSAEGAIGRPANHSALQA